MKDPANILGKLEDHFVPTRNILYMRYVFHSTEQQLHETVDQFMIKLRQLAEPCKFGNLEDDMVRDRLVFGCKDSAARGRLFREKYCDLKKAIESLRISEATKEQLKKIGNKSTQDPVHFVRKEGKAVEKPRKKPPGGSRMTQMSAKETSESSECKYCSGQHEWINTKCPAYAKSCRKCGKYNHFQSVCQQKQPTVHQLNEDSDPEEPLYYVEWVGTVQHHHKKQFFVHLRFRDESGETVPVPVRHWSYMQRHALYRPMRNKAAWRPGYTAHHSKAKASAWWRPLGNATYVAITKVNNTYSTSRSSVALSNLSYQVKHVHTWDWSLLMW